jgi:hypothetical protein
LATKLSSKYVATHAKLARKMRTLHKARTVLESIWVLAAVGGFCAACVLA